ncbi:MAG: metalloregulator ArsR/SmtB family transcription factor, partial [Acholeplasma sp.]|nr:metalloregulator ArsR/SmtB family transcription factor [Acholeplasma sp.]
MRACDMNCNCHIFHEETLNKVKSDILNDNEIENIVEFFKIIADFTRLKILEAIKDEELCVCDLAHLLGVTKSAISHQMRVFKEHNLVVSNKKGKMVYYRLNEGFVATVIKKVDEYIRGN